MLLVEFDVPLFLVVFCILAEILVIERVIRLHGNPTGLMRNLSLARLERIHEAIYGGSHYVGSLFEWIIVAEGLDVLDAVNHVIGQRFE